MNIHILISALALTPLFAMAHSTEPDSIKTQELDEVVVEARNQRLGAEVSTYIPTSKQRNASQTAADLLNRMAIPQIKISANDDITDLAGKSVDVFIDFLPASKEDLQGMRMQDVKKVEYYDFPSDPRFQGKAHVVNFVMQKYEYGGYVKAFGWENTSNAGQASLYGKLQYKRMTFDIATGYFYLSQKHTGVSRGRNGFRKDKGGEELAESEEDLLEHRTDGTDAFDTLYIGCEKFTYHDTFPLSMSGVL